MREPGASPGRSRRCEGRRSPATKPLARAGKAAREGAPSQKTCRAPHIQNPSRKGGFRCFALSSYSPERRWLRSAVSVAGASGGAAASARSRSPSTGSNGKVTVSKRPARIVSLSPTATETLFAIGAGSQVVAVDDQSDSSEDRPADVALGLHAERRGDRRLPARPRRHRVRPEGPLRGARTARDHGPPPRRRQELRGRVPADPAARPRHRARGSRVEADRRA